MKLAIRPDAQATRHGGLGGRGWVGVGRERRGPYDHGAGDDEPVGPSLRDAVRDLERSAARVLALAGDDDRPEGGELGGLVELCGVSDRVNAAMVELVDRAERRSLAERSTGLPLEGILSFQTRATLGDRRMLTNASATLRSMPHLREAFHVGAVGWAEVRTIVAEARTLDAAARTRLDAGFEDHDRLGRWEADRLVDAVRDAVGRLAPQPEQDEAVRRYERRYLHAQLGFDGSVAGTFELDAEAAAPVLTALEAAMPPPSAGPRDASRDAEGEGDLVDADTDGDALGRADGVVATGVAAPEPETPDGEPAFCDPVPSRSRARQRADALVDLAEAWLGGQRADGSSRRARPRLTAVCDVRDLTGDGDGARAARLLLETTGGPAALTPAAVRRLASDADLQFLVHVDGEILGISEPTATIPAKVRAAVEARDQGCRFPGCSLPIRWCDLHHVTARADRGWTIVSNLVALCRRHHTAVTEERWRLSMTTAGTVTVRRGRRTATSDPPWRRVLLSD